MINDTSQRSVATWFRCGGTFDLYFNTNYCWVCFKIFLNHSTFGKSWLPQAPCAPEHYPAARWTRFIYLTYGGRNILHTRYVLLWLMAHADLYTNCTLTSLIRLSQMNELPTTYVLSSSHIIRIFSHQTSGIVPMTAKRHRCKKSFYVFYSCHVFTFLTFLIFRAFFLKTLKICFLCKLIVRFNFL